MQAPEGVAPLLNGGCFCGQVTYSVYGPPLLSVYCHCTDCQKQMGKFSHTTRQVYKELKHLKCPGCPFVHALHFREIDFVWTWMGSGRSSGEVLDNYESPFRQHRRRFRCQRCGTPVACFDARTGHYIVWGASLERGQDGEVLEWVQVKPTAHEFYGTRMLDVNDELTKWEGYQAKSTKLD